MLIAPHQPQSQIHVPRDTLRRNHINAKRHLPDRRYQRNSPCNPLPLSIGSKQHQGKQWCKKRCMMVDVWDEVCAMRCILGRALALHKALNCCACPRKQLQEHQMPHSKAGLCEMSWMRVEWVQLGDMSSVSWIVRDELGEMSCVRWVEWVELCEVSWVICAVREEVREMNGGGSDGGEGGGRRGQGAGCRSKTKKHTVMQGMNI